MSDETIRELKFTNRSATPKTVSLGVTSTSVASIMAWYGAYHSGDRYRVELDGVTLKKDVNGELVGGSLT